MIKKRTSGAKALINGFFTALLKPCLRTKQFFPAAKAALVLRLLRAA
jgi:hypothetical protein